MDGRARRSSLGRIRPPVAAICALAAGACTGGFDPIGYGDGTGGPGASGGGGNGPPVVADPAVLYQRTTVRRLTQSELGSTIRDLLLADRAATLALQNLGHWPPDDKQPYDNDY